jgi:hypothetical protein
MSGNERCVTAKRKAMSLLKKMEDFAEVGQGNVHYCGREALWCNESRFVSSRKITRSGTAFGHVLHRLRKFPVEVFVIPSSKRLKRSCVYVWKNFLMLVRKVPWEWTPRLKQADISTISQLLCCWVNWGGPWSAASAQWNQRAKKILCNGEVLAEYQWQEPQYIQSNTTNHLLSDFFPKYLGNVSPNQLRRLAAHF